MSPLLTLGTCSPSILSPVALSFRILAVRDNPSAPVILHSSPTTTFLQITTFLRNSLLFAFVLNILPHDNLLSNNHFSTIFPLHELLLLEPRLARCLLQCTSVADHNSR